MFLADNAEIFETGALIITPSGTKSYLDNTQTSHTHTYTHTNIKIYDLKLQVNNSCGDLSATIFMIVLPEKLI